MRRISLVLAISLLASCHAQVLPGAPSSDPNALVSPWSQWMSLKAPPIPGLPMGGSKAKKKLVPGPPPPEGTPEAPWVSWTRTKISSALPASTAASSPGLPPLPPPPPPPSPAVGNDSSSSTPDGGEPSVWIQWTQMKLPLTSPLTPPSSSAAAPATPWDAWTNLKIGQLLAPPPSPPAAPQVSPVRRMAPDRYKASTMAPRLTSWVLPNQQTSQSSSSSSSSSQNQPPVSYVSPRPTYQDILNASLLSPQSQGQTSTSFVSQSSVNPAAASKYQVAPPQTLAQALQPIPHQLVSQIIAKATPEELTSVILAVSQAEDQESDTTPSVTVGQLLPASLVAKIPDDLTPLLTTPLKPPASTSDLNPKPLSILPPPARLAVISQATPEELEDLLDTLTKLETLPPKDQAAITSLSVATVLPTSLQIKIPSAVATLPLVPPALLSLPPTLVTAVLPVATPSEVEALIANAAKLEKIPYLDPRPPVGALLPASLITKVPPTLAPLLSQPVSSSSDAVTTTIPPVLAALPPPIVQEVVTKATPPEIKTITKALTVLEAVVPLIGVVPPVISAIPSTVISKLSPELQPLLTQPVLVTTPLAESEPVSTVLKAIPPPVLQTILSVAVPEELAAIEENVVAAGPVTTSVFPLLPTSLVAKLPPQVAPILSQTVVTLPPPEPAVVPVTIPGVPEEVTTALSALPSPAIMEILKVATPEEISTVSETVTKLEALPAAEKPLISALDVATILPATLLSKLPPSVLPLLSAPVLIPEIAPALPAVSGVPPEVVAAIAPALSALPPPAISEILKVATPEEIAAITETISKLEALLAADKPLPAVKVATILPPTLMSKLPPSVIPMMSAPLVIPEVAPAAPTSSLPVVPGVPPEILADIAPVLSALPPILVSQILSVATPAELLAVKETVTKLEALPPSEAPLVSKLEVESILPPSLVAKLPSEAVPLLEAPITIPAAPAPLPVIPGVAPEVAEVVIPALAAVPSPVVSQILATASPVELVTLKDTIAELEALPPSQIPLVANLEVETILPPTLLAKLPPSVAPLLSVTVTLPTAVPPTAPPSPIPVAPVELTPETVETVETALSALPPKLLTKLLTVATPEEIAAIAETITKLEALPPAEAPLVAKLEVATILPPSLLAKVPPSVIPVLSVPITLPATAPARPAEPEEIIAPVLSAVPPTVVSAILSVAAPVELATLADTITRLEALPPAQLPLASKIEVATILPPTLLAKVPLSVAPLLSVPITLSPAPAITPPPVGPAIPIPPAPEEVPPPPADISKIPPALSAVPPAVVQEILTVATPEELSEVANTLAEIEALPPSELPLAQKVEVATILPATLVSKLPPSILPLLSVPITLPPPAQTARVEAYVPSADEPLVIPGLPPSIVSVAVPPLSALPPPVISKILTTATPSELAQVVDTVLKLNALQPADKEAATVLEVGSVLPPTLIQKLPPPVIPLLSAPITIPDVPVAPPKIPTPPVPAPVTPVILGVPPEIVSTILPALTTLPPPVANTILTTAIPPELALIADTVSKLKVLPPPTVPIPIAAILPPPLLSRLPPPIPPILVSTPLDLNSPLPTPTPAPVLPTSPLNTETATEPVPAAEEKVLTKWAKVILEKTGKPSTATPAPGEIPPLQAAWMEWIALKVNASKPSADATPAPTTAESATTEFPWTQWLKLKSNVTTLPTPPLLDVSTESPEKALLEYLESLSPTEAPPAVTSPITSVPISPETEALVAEALKENGIEIVDLPPEEVKAILEQVQKSVVPAPLPPPRLIPPPHVLPYLPYIPSKPLARFWPPPPPPAVYVPPASPASSDAPPVSPEATPTLNLTEYLIANSLLPPETSPTKPIPLPTLTSLLTSSPIAPPPTSTSLTPEELSALTPTKFASILQQILKDCRVNATTASNTTSLATRSVYPNPYASYYKKKYSPYYRGKRSPNPALYPIPSQAFTPTSTPSPTSSLPLPKLDTSNTVLDPAYWAAQKSMFLSKLFNTLAKVALNDTTSTPSPKEQLAKQVNTVLLSDMTRSVHHHPPKKQPPPPPEDSSEDTYDDYPADQAQDDSPQQEQEEDAPDFNSQEKQLVNNDDSQPKLPKEPENPLHKLFKFGVQKTVLSDLSTTPSPVFVYVTPPPSYYYPTATAVPPPVRAPVTAYQHYPAYHAKSKSKVYKKKKPSKNSSHNNHRGHHSNSQKSAKHPSRFRHSTSTTTENPVDFELLAKALLLDDASATSSGTGIQTRSQSQPAPNAGPGSEESSET